MARKKRSVADPAPWRRRKRCATSVLRAIAKRHFRERDYREYSTRSPNGVRTAPFAQSPVLAPGIDAMGSRCNEPFRVSSAKGTYPCDILQPPIRCDNRRADRLI